MKIRFFPRKEKKTSPNPESSRLPHWLPGAAWVLVVIALLIMAAILYKVYTGSSVLSLLPIKTSSEGSGTVSSLPNLSEPYSFDSITRKANADTNLPQSYRKEIIDYIVESGDSIFGIAKNFDIKPESILWANYNILNDDPHMISLGTDLKIPPVDGILYEWQEGDTLQKVADKYNAKVEDILLWPGNNLDISNPVIEPGTTVMIPGGSRELRPWVVPVVASGPAGVNAKISGPGSCTPEGGAVGTLSFVWPTSYYGQVSGNDYWAGHLALDIMCFQGDSIFASDSGVVIYCGSIGGGYGNLVAIDHRNGYLTLYAHVSAFNVSCGQSVSRGQTIAFCGSTGNSTGAHLHFEVRKGGAFINPWLVLQ